MRAAAPLLPKRPPRPRAGERGATAVETALVLPLLLLVIFGAIETGNALSIWLTIQKGCEVGARFAATGMGEIEGTRLSQIISATTTFLANSRGQGANVSVRSWPGVSPTGAGRENNPGTPCDTVEIQVTYNYTAITPISALMGLFGAGSSWAGTIPISAKVRRVNEPWQPCP